MRENFTYGSVGGASGNRRIYPEGCPFKIKFWGYKSALRFLACKKNAKRLSFIQTS